jgi:molybdopterin-guanine dinucleotide biosynthesis protein A
MPGDLLSRLLVHLDKGGECRCFILRGEVGAGKTRAGERLAMGLKKQGVKVGGIISPRILDGDETVGYTVYDLASGEQRLFADTRPPGIAVGKFFISPEGLAFARNAIERAAAKAHVVFLDEVGRLELDGRGLATAVRTLLDSSAVPVLLVRQSFIPAVLRAFSIHRYGLFDVSSV